MNHETIIVGYPEIHKRSEKDYFIEKGLDPKSVDVGVEWAFSWYGEYTQAVSGGSAPDITKLNSIRDSVAESLGIAIDGKYMPSLPKAIAYDTFCRLQGERAAEYNIYLRIDQH